MKTWKVEYSIKYIDGSEEPAETVLRARSIRMALAQMQIMTKELLRTTLSISDIEVQGIQMINEQEGK